MGYGGEAVRAILEYAGEELEAPRVVLRIDSGNTASLRFAERLGFHKSDRILENERSTFFIYLRIVNKKLIEYYKKTSNLK